MKNDKIVTILFGSIMVCFLLVIFNTRDSDAHIKELADQKADLMEANSTLVSQNAALEQQIATLTTDIANLQAENAAWQALCEQQSAALELAQNQSTPIADDAVEVPDASTGDNSDPSLVDQAKDAASAAADKFVEGSNQFGHYMGDQLGEYVEQHPDGAIAKAMDKLVDLTEDRILQMGLTPEE